MVCVVLAREKPTNKSFCWSEIPLFHVLNARITFGNVNGCSTADESQGVEGTPAEAGKTNRKLVGKTGNWDFKIMFWMLNILK